MLCAADLAHVKALVGRSVLVPLHGRAGLLDHSLSCQPWALQGLLGLLQDDLPKTLPHQRLSQCPVHLDDQWEPAQHKSAEWAKGERVISGKAYKEALKSAARQNVCR